MRAPMERQAKALQQFVDVSGLKKVADGFTSIARNAADAFNSLVRIVPVMGTLTGAASIAGITKLVESWNAFSGGLTRDAARIGTTAAELQRYQDIITLAGGSTEDMTAGLKELAQAMSDAVTGDPQKFAVFLNQLGVNLYNANGQLKTAAQAMPEVLAALDKIPGAYDRQKIAAAAGIPGLVALVNQLDREKRAGESLIDTWNRLNTEAGKYADITKDQEAAQHRYETAIGALSVAFTHLKEGVGAVIGEALTPLLNQLAEFVRTHTPEITAAIQQIVTGFSDWIQGIDWKSVKEGADSVVDALKFVGEHLNTIVKVALVIKGLQIATGIVSSITSIMGVIGTIGGVTGGALLAGTGLLGALGLVVWLSIEIYRHWDEIKGAISAVGDAAVSAGKQVMQNLGNIHLPGAGEGPPAPTGPPGPPRPTPGAINPFTGQPIPPAEAIGKADPLALIEGPESGGRNLAPGTSSTPGGVPTSASGYYQFLEPTWRETAGKLGIDTNKYPTAYSAPRNVQQAVAAQLYNEKGFQPWTTDPRSPIPGKIAAAGGAGAFPKFIDPQQYLNPQAPGGAPGVPSQESLQANFAARTGAFGTVEEAAKKQVTITAPNGAKWQVNAGAADQFSGFLNDLYKEYPGLQSGGGYNPRQIRGGTGWSAHAWGTAIDINPDTNKLGSTSTDLPADVGQLASKWGLKWGGTFQGRKDPMHFEIAELRQDVAALNPKAEGAPAQVTGGPPVSGSVDVTVTHRNPPPGVTVTAQGQGDVNVARPRTEQQQLQSI